MRAHFGGRISLTCLQITGTICTKPGSRQDLQLLVMGATPVNGGFQKGEFPLPLQSLDSDGWSPAESVPISL